MEGTPAPGYDYDDSSSVYHGAMDAGSMAPVNGDSMGHHSPNSQGNSSHKANNTTWVPPN